MRFEQLQYLAAVPRYGSLRRASEPLHVSVPALSEGISRLEQELGLTLLDRQRSGSRISEQGREILPAVIDVLEAVERLRGAARRQSTERPRLRIGGGQPTVHGAVADTVRGLREEGHPFATEIRTLPDERVIAGVAEGTLDVGLLTLGAEDDVPPDLAATPVAEGRPVAVIPRGHALARRTSIAAADLRDESVVALTDCAAHRRITADLFGPSPPGRVISVDSPELGAVLVADGAGIGLLPDFSVADGVLVRSGAIILRPLDGTVRGIRLVAVHRRRSTLPPGLRAFLQTIRRRAAGTPQEPRRADGASHPPTTRRPQESAPRTTAAASAPA